MLYPQANIDELNKSINRKQCCLPKVIHVYHKWACAIFAILNKVTEYLCSFFEVPGNGLALLGMPCYE